MWFGRAQLDDDAMWRLGNACTIFIVSRLTLIARSNSSNGWRGLPMVSVAQLLASLTIPLSLSVLTPWRSTTQSKAGLLLTT